MANQTSHVTGSVETALSHAARLLELQPSLALEQADEILRIVPDNPHAMLIAARAQFALGDGNSATQILQRITMVAPRFADGWWALGDQLHFDGDDDGGDRAHREALRVSISDPELLIAADALASNDLPRAEVALRARLKQHPTDIAAIRMMAELAGRIGRNRDAENLLRRALELAPGFDAARHNLALALHRHGNPAEALENIEILLAHEPANASYAILKAAILGRLGDYAAAVAMYREILARYPRQSKVWMSLGHALKTLGLRQESVDAYRESLRREPSLGSAWWSLANLKTFLFSQDDIAAMHAALKTPNLSEEDSYQIEFALGKAEEDAGQYHQSFIHYAQANQRRRAALDYDSNHVSQIVDRQRATLDDNFFAERSGWGCPTTDPIFVVSLPRSGSTLVEQILASHSEVEGTMELPDIGMLAGRLGPGGIATLRENEARALGEEYIERTQVQRKLGRRYFVDKMPNNWLYIPLIQLILPNAKIVDARRHPLGCGFSLFKQHFARGQSFSYDLAEIGRYYRDYARAMAHLDRVLPGRVHRVFYERMIDDTKTQVKSLLDYAGLQFEEACLRFHETERAVRTASSEQVRRPIFREGMDHWRNFDAWLGPLKIELGEVLDHYPNVLDEL